MDSSSSESSFAIQLHNASFSTQSEIRIQNHIDHEINFISNSNHSVGAEIELDVASWADVEELASSLKTQNFKRDVLKKVEI